MRAAGVEPGGRPAPAARASEAQRAATEHLSDLRARAQYARERYQLYKAKTHGQRPTSPARLRELQRLHEQAEARIRAAESEAKRSADGGHPRG